MLFIIICGRILGTYSSVWMSSNTYNMFRIILVYDILLMLTLLTAQILIFREYHFRRELAMESSLLDSQYQQFQTYQETVNNIRHKCHDLKHLLFALETEGRLPESHPYFHELKGQILFETGQIQPSIEAYQNALHYLPDSLLINLSYANVLLESAKPNEIDQALSALLTVTHQDAEIPAAWQLLGRAYDLQGERDLANYAMAEFYMSTNQISEAKRMAKKAIKGLEKDTVSYQRTKDIIEISE